MNLETYRSLERRRSAHLDLPDRPLEHFRRGIEGVLPVRRGQVAVLHRLRHVHLDDDVLEHLAHALLGAHGEFDAAGGAALQDDTVADVERDRDHAKKKESL